MIKFKNFNFSILGLRKEHIPLFSNLSFEMTAGTCLGIFGPNGCGKSTILKEVLRASVEPNSALICDAKISEIGYLPQNFRSALFPWLKNKQLIDLYVKGNSTDTDSLFEHFGYSFNLDKYSYQMSGGEQQAFALGCSLSRNPRLVLLDEPFSAIDIGRRKKVKHSLSKWLRQTGSTAIIISHSIEDLGELCDQVILLSGERPNKEIILIKKDTEFLNEISKFL